MVEEGVAGVGGQRQLQVVWVRLLDAGVGGWVEGGATGLAVEAARGRPADLVGARIVVLAGQNDPSDVGRVLSQTRERAYEPAVADVALYERQADVGGVQ